MTAGFFATLILTACTAAAAMAQQPAGEVLLHVPAQGGPLTPLFATFHPTMPGLIGLYDDSDGSIGLWSAEGGYKKVLKIEAHAINGSLAISPDGMLIATSGDDSLIRFWNPDGTPHGEPMKGHEGPIRKIVFSPDGKMLASAGWDKTVRLWSVAEARAAREPFLGHTAWVRAVAFSRDGKIVASSSVDRTIRLWNVDGTPRGALNSRQGLG